MYIDFKKLRDNGFHVDVDKTGVHIDGNSPTDEQVEAGRHFAALLNLDARDTDDVIGYALETGFWSKLRSICR